ncbi:MAG TPA: hypothetical protein VGL81_32805 [Polyangiaceae bacterium]|jgi:hypothetical protein
MARGGLLAIAAAGAGAVLVVVVGVVLVMRGCSGDPASTGRPAGNGVGSRAGIAEEGMHAPGTAELARIGCEHALVVDMAKLLGDPSRIRPGEPRTMVTCDVAAGVDPPTCERAAAVYFGAVGGMADENVGVRVLRSGSAAPVCSRLYAPNGADLGSFPRAP